jgi:hypothetical protein
MKALLRITMPLVICALAATSLFAASIPVRGSSRNGSDDIAQFWALFGPTQVVTLTKGTTTVNYKQQVVCPTQDVTAAVNPSDTLHDGTCEGGSYMFIFQLRSSATNVNVQLSGLSGFTQDDSSPSYGVVLCDSSTNTLELCTTATEAQLPAITFSHNATNTTVNFVISSFPKFPNGKKHQGQGLTIFVITNQTAPNPINLPVITLK